MAPVIKISGNPMTVKSMRDNIDVDVSGVINQGLTLDQATDIVQDKLVDVCSRSEEHTSELQSR